MKSIGLTEAILSAKKLAATHPQAPKVAVHANYRFHQLRLFIGAYLAQLGSPHEVWEEEYGGLQKALFSNVDPSVSAHILVIDSDSLSIGSSLRNERSLDANEDPFQVTENYVQLVQGFVQKTKANVLVLLLDVRDAAYEFTPACLPSTEKKLWQHAVSQFIWRLEKEANCTVLPFENLDIDAARFVKTGEPLLSATASQVAADVAHVLVLKQKGQSKEIVTKKILVTDLDNTFWAGIVGDDGWESLVFDQSDAGIRHWLYQRFLNQLTREGIILVAVTKNSEHVVTEAFSKLKLPCPRDRFAGVVANWDKKSENIKSICEMFNILPEHVVFVDDNHLELSETQTAIPSLTTLVFPQKIDAMADFLKEVRSHFLRAFPSTDIQRRLESYKSVVELRKFSVANKENSEAYNNYLRSLEMQLKFEACTRQNAARIFELVNKTNQFNLNGCRIATPEFESLKNKPHAIFAISLADKLFDFGIIGAVLISMDKHIANVSYAVLSCRVFSRGIEGEMMRQALSWISKSQPHVKEIYIHLKKTPKNQPVFDLFKSLKWNEGDEKKVALNELATDLEGKFLGRVEVSEV